MSKLKYFKTTSGARLPLPVFFPDATRGVIKTLDSQDIKATKTPGVLVNTYHLYNETGEKIIKKHGDIRGFMNWQGGVISDSGGFQIMSLVKSAYGKGKVSNEGVSFQITKKRKLLFTPEMSIKFQIVLKPDMLVVLDDFTPPSATRKEAKETVDRTIVWANRCKLEFDKICKREDLTKMNRPYLLAVVQGGDFLDLRIECINRLKEIGFDGYGYGGWPVNEKGEFNYSVAQCISENAPEGAFLYGLGIGKPEEIVGCVKFGFNIFDCVLPTRDARHKRLYVYNAKSINDINVHKASFYKFYEAGKEKHLSNTKPISLACDCLLCTNYSRGYLAHLFKIKELTAMRLATIHNLRFYSILMEKLRGL